MNDKILDILEFNRITDQLKDLAITEPAREKAETLRPSSDADKVKAQLDQTYTLTNILRIKGNLPLTNFKDVRPSTKRLRIKANLNSKEFGNILLILTLANDITGFMVLIFWRD